MSFTDARSQAEAHGRTNLDDVAPIEGAQDLDDLFDAGADDASSDGSRVSFDEAMRQAEARRGQEEEEPAGDEDETEEAATPDASDQETPAATEKPEDKAKTVAESDKEEEAPDASAAALTTFNEAFPDLGAASVDDVVEALRMERQANDLLVAVVDAHPSIGQLIKALHGGGDLADVVQEHLADVLQVPDAEKEPEKHAEWLKSQGRREAEQRVREERTREMERAVEQLQATAVKSIDVLAGAEKFDDATKKRVASQISDFVDNPTDQFATVIYRGLHHQQLLDEAVKAAELRGRNAAIEELKNQRQNGQGDGIARFNNGRTEAPENATDKERDARALARQLRRSDDPLAAFLG